jgi:hypothetical protein
MLSVPCVEPERNIQTIRTIRVKIVTPVVTKNHRPQLGHSVKPVLNAAQQHQTLPQRVLFATGVNTRTKRLPIRMPVNSARKDFLFRGQHQRVRRVHRGNFKIKVQQYMQFVPFAQWVIDLILRLLHVSVALMASIKTKTMFRTFNVNFVLLEKNQVPSLCPVTIVQAARFKTKIPRPL